MPSPSPAIQTIIYHKHDTSFSTSADGADCLPLARLEASGHGIDTILRADLQELHAVHEGLSTALILLDHAGEVALPGNGLCSLLQPLNQRFQQALMRVNDLI